MKVPHVLIGAFILNSLLNGDHHLLKSKSPSFCSHLSNMKTYQGSCMGGHVGFPRNDKVCWRGTPPSLSPACQWRGEWAALRRQPAVGTARFKAALSSSEACRKEHCDSPKKRKKKRGGGSLHLNPLLTPPHVLAKHKNHSQREKKQKSKKDRGK